MLIVLHNLFTELSPVNDLGKKAAQKQSVLKPSFAGFLYPVSHLTLLSLGKEKQHLFPTTLNSPN